MKEQNNIRKEFDEFKKKAAEQFGKSNGKVYAVLSYSDTFEVLEYNDFYNEVCDADKLLDLRIFDETAEMRLYRDYCGQDFYPIVIVSDELLKSDYYDDYQYVDIDLKRTLNDRNRRLGMVRATGGGWYRFPFDSENELNGLKVKIRNYVTYDENGQASLYAWRLVGFKTKC